MKTSFILFRASDAYWSRTRKVVRRKRMKYVPCGYNKIPLGKCFDPCIASLVTVIFCVLPTLISIPARQSRGYIPPHSCGGFPQGFPCVQRARLVCSLHRSRLHTLNNNKSTRLTKTHRCFLCCFFWTNPTTVVFFVVSSERILPPIGCQDVLLAWNGWYCGEEIGWEWSREDSAENIRWCDLRSNPRCERL